MLTPEEWAARYLRQAAWSAEIRRHLWQRVGLRPGQRVLELGCGAGAISGDFPVSRGVKTCGLDLSEELLRLVAQPDSPTAYLRADAYLTPFLSESFDHVFCHMFLLWIALPGELLAEAIRLLRPGGWFLAFAEPDHAGRIDYPPPLDELGKLQIQALAKQGANPQRGRQLAALLNQAGLVRVEAGLTGGQWRMSGALDGLDDEWRVIRDDLANFASKEQLESYYQVDVSARQYGERILFVPTFYAIGQKPS